MIYLENNNIYACLEIGSFEIKCLVCNFREERMYVLSNQSVPSIGIDRGQVTNFDKLVGQIRKVKELTEKDLNQNLDHIMLAIPPIDTFVEPAFTTINLDINQPIDAEDMRLLFRQISEQPFAETLLPVNVIPRLFRIDENHLVQNPRGLSGRVLMLEATRVFAPITIVSNLIHAVESAKLKIADITTGSISEALSALSSPEMFLRTCHMNIGHDMTTITVVNDGKVIHAHSLPMGGRDITRAIADEFGISETVANELKVDFGQVVLNEEQSKLSDKVIYMEDIKRKTFITRGMLNQVITVACDRIFKEIKQYVVDTLRIREQEYHYSLSGATAEFPNMLPLLQQNFPTVEVSIYKPSMLGVRSAKYAQIVGAAIFAHEFALLVGSKSYNIKFDAPGQAQEAIKKAKVDQGEVTLSERIPSLIEDDAQPVEDGFLVENNSPMLKDLLTQIEPEQDAWPSKVFGEDDISLLEDEPVDDYMDKKLENSGVLVRFFDRIFNENDEVEN